MARAGTVGLLIVDDHTAIAQALASSLRASGFDPVVVSDGARAAAVVELAARHGVTLALVDLHLGRGADADGRALIGPLRALGTAVVILSGVTDDARRGQCLLDGAAAVLDKAAPFDDIVATLDAVARGAPAMPEHERRSLIEEAQEAGGRPRFDLLTAREARVLRHLMDGRSAAEIAAADGVKLSTVRSQIQSILTKLGVRSQQAAIALAHRTRF